MSQPHVPMPIPVIYQKERGQKFRDYIVRTFGEATLATAERAVIMDILIVLGVVSQQQLMDMIEIKCKQIDELRRRQAMGDNG